MFWHVQDMLVVSGTKHLPPVLPLISDAGPGRGQEPYHPYSSCVFRDPVTNRRKRGIDDDLLTLIRHDFRGLFGQTMCNEELACVRIGKNAIDDVVHHRVGHPRPTFLWPVALAR